ncbi:hypothetical protein BH10ACI2_BH10ACI2_15080 [soil metagenome]
MEKPADLKVESSVTSAIIGLFLSLLVGGGTGYWAYILDPTGTGGSVLIFPAFIVMGLVSIAFLAVGYIMRGWPLVIGFLAAPFLFFAVSNIFRFLLND